MTSNGPCPGVWPVWTPRTQMAGFKKYLYFFKKRIIEHRYTQNIKAPGRLVSKKIFVCFFHCKYMGANITWDEAMLSPRGIIGRIYVKRICITMLHTKYTSFESCGFREDFFI